MHFPQFRNTNHRPPRPGELRRHIPTTRAVNIEPTIEGGAAVEGAPSPRSLDARTRTMDIMSWARKIVPRMSVEPSGVEEILLWVALLCE
eukprot:4914863-Pyramimonas_sp.AAC.1